MTGLRAVSVSPVMRFSRMSWSTVSNAADRSRRMRREGEPASDDIRSFVTLTSAEEVEYIKCRITLRQGNYLFSKLEL